MIRLSLFLGKQYFRRNDALLRDPRFLIIPAQVRLSMFQLHHLGLEFAMQGLEEVG